MQPEPLTKGFMMNAIDISFISKANGGQILSMFAAKAISSI
jgi:hypothetical protein